MRKHVQAPGGSPLDGDDAWGVFISLQARKVGAFRLGSQPFGWVTAVHRSATVRRCARSVAERGAKEIASQTGFELV